MTRLSCLGRLRISFCTFVYIMYCTCTCRSLEEKRREIRRGKAEQETGGVGQAVLWICRHNPVQRSDNHIINLSDVSTVRYIDSKMYSSTFKYLEVAPPPKAKKKREKGLVETIDTLNLYHVH